MSLGAAVFTIVVAGIGTAFARHIAAMRRAGVPWVRGSDGGSGPFTGGGGGNDGGGCNGDGGGGPC